MYDNILVPVSFDTERDSAGALAVAKHLAGENGKIALLHVVEQVPSYVLSALPSEYQSDARKTAEKELAPLCQRSCPPLCFSSISQVGGIG